MNKQLFFIASLTTITALILGLGGGYWYAIKKAPQQPQPIIQEEVDKVLFYRNPMNPKITSPTPVQDEMGMDYIPVYADGGPKKNEPAGTVEIDPVTVQNIGVRTTTAKTKVISRIIRSIGRIDYNEERLSRIHPKVEGWIDELYIKKTGERVEKDTILRTIYSPQLVASQQEYLLALRNLEILQSSPFKTIRQGATSLAKSSRKRLEFLDVPTHQIEELSKERIVKKNLHIHSPFARIVMNLGVRKGDYVSPKTELYMLADLSRVWVYVDVYEYELPWVATGDPAEMTVVAVPGKIYKGEVTYIYPYMEKKTRTARVRLEFDNRDGKLKPDMFANVTLKADRKIEAVVVPSEAIVRSGNRVQVFIQRGKGKFEPREVQLGISAGGVTQIISGLMAEERVVTSSQFLIDSESKLREATAKMIEVMGAANMTDMDDMDMKDVSLEALKHEDMDMSNTVPKEK